MVGHLNSGPHFVAGARQAVSRRSPNHADPAVGQSRHRWSNLNRMRSGATLRKIQAVANPSKGVPTKAEGRFSVAVERATFNVFALSIRIRSINRTLVERLDDCDFSPVTNPDRSTLCNNRFSATHRRRHLASLVIAASKLSP